jgi:hypothetical protein
MSNASLELTHIVLHEDICKLSGNKTYDMIVIVAGGDDCSNSINTTTIVKSFKKLVKTTVSEANTVTVQHYLSPG